MLTTEEYAKQIREQKIKELREILDKKKIEIELYFLDEMLDKTIFDHVLYQEKEYFKLMRKFLRLTGVIKPYNSIILP